MAYLGNAPARSFISFERQVFTIVNSQTAYTLDHSVNNENDLRLVINNIVQEPGSGKAYTASGTTLTLSAALTNGTDEMYCVFLGRATATNAPGAGSVNTAAIADLNVTTAKIAADAITEAKIADDAVESEHLNNNVISGQTELAAEPADTDEFLISDAGTLKRIDYSYIKGGGRNTLLATQTISSGVSYFDMTDIMTDTHNNYLLAFHGVRFSVDGSDIRVTFFTGSGTGGHVAGGSDYKFAYSEIRSDGTMSTSYDTGSAFYRPNKSGVGNGSNEAANGQLQFFDMRGTIKRQMYGEVHFTDANNNFVSNWSVGGSDMGDAACTGLRFEAASGNIIAGTFKLYGQE